MAFSHFFLKEEGEGERSKKYKQKECCPYRVAECCQLPEHIISAKPRRFCRTRIGASTGTRARTRRTRYC